MRIGAVPVPVSTMLHADGLAELLRDSRARVLGGDGALRCDRRRGTAAGARGARGDHGRRRGRHRLPVHRLDELTGPRRRSCGLLDHRGLARVLALHLGHDRAAEGARCTGTASIQVVCETYGQQVLGITAGRPVPVGGEGVLRLRPRQLACCSRCRSARRRCSSPAPSTPDVIAERAPKYGATLFFAGPTFFANMLRADLPADALGRRPARRVGGRGAAGSAVPAVDRRTSASTSSTASA